MRNELQREFMWSVYITSLGLGHRWADAIRRRAAYDLLDPAKLSEITSIAQEDDQGSVVSGILYPNIEFGGNWYWYYTSPGKRVHASVVENHDSVNTTLIISRPYRHEIVLAYYTDGYSYRAEVSASGIFEMRHAQLFRRVWGAVEYYLRPSVDQSTARYLSQLMYLSSTPAIWATHGMLLSGDYHTDGFWYIDRYTSLDSRNVIVVHELGGPRYVQWQEEVSHD